MASIIKADNIQKVSDGTNIIKKCGSTTTIGSGACSPIVICGSTVTLGRTGGTVQLACGATQSGFGQTYSAVAYCTTVKTAPFTAVAGKGYFVNTCAGSVTVTLPASPTAGDVISIKDYKGTFATNSVSIANNGNKINGVCANSALSTNGQAISLIYVDATQGWEDIQDSTSNVTGNQFIVASGGTESTCGNYKIHTFTADGCFTVSTLALCAAYQKVDYLVVAGGGSAGQNIGGGGGAGGYRESHCSTVSGCYTASPIASATSLPVTVTTYPITVGGGGAVGPTPTGVNGSNSVFSTITSAGGGGGGAHPSISGLSGGSGGGGGGDGTSSAGSGNTPPVTPPQGSPGSVGSPNYPQLAAGGGGGALQSGQPSSNCRAGDGGDGAATGIIPGPAANLIPIGGSGPVPSLRYYGGGGGGGIYTQPQPNPSASYGGDGGGGRGWGNGVPYPCTAVRTGAVNSGGGSGQGAAGGSGVVIIRYRYQ